MTSVSLHGFALFLPLYFQVALGVSVTLAGRMLAPMLLGMVMGAILAGQLLSRAGGNYRLQLLVNTALMAAGVFLFSTLSDGWGFSRSRPILFSQVCLVITALGFGGVVATPSVAVQNAAPFRKVGVATAALQFCGSLGGMIGLAATGAVLVQSFRSRTEMMIFDKVRATLPEGLLDSEKKNPQVLMDTARAESMRETLAETSAGDPPLADTLLNSFNLALMEALRDVFTVLRIAVALSFAVALFLRVPADTDHH